MLHSSDPYVAVLERWQPGTDKMLTNAKSRKNMRKLMNEKASAYFDNIDNLVDNNGTVLVLT